MEDTVPWLKVVKKANFHIPARYGSLQKKTTGTVWGDIILLDGLTTPLNVLLSGRNQLRMKEVGASLHAVKWEGHCVMMLTEFIRRRAPAPTNWAKCMAVSECRHEIFWALSLPCILSLPSIASRKFGIHFENPQCCNLWRFYFDSGIFKGLDKHFTSLPRRWKCLKFGFADILIYTSCLSFIIDY